VAICDGIPRPIFHNLLSQSRRGLFIALVALSAPLARGAATPAAPVEFNPAFLQGGSQVDVSRFSRGNPVLPGDYLVDVQINSKWKGRASVHFNAQPDSDIALPCIDRTLVARIGLDFEKLSPADRAKIRQSQSDGCIDLKAMIADAEVAFDLSQLRLDISVPQAALLVKPRGYVSPEFWDSGVTSATLATTSMPTAPQPPT
jgi:outer membrane usher protein